MILPINFSHRNLPSPEAMPQTLRNAVEKWELCIRGTRGQNQQLIPLSWLSHHSWRDLIWTTIRESSFQQLINGSSMCCWACAIFFSFSVVSWQESVFPPPIFFVCVSFTISLHQITIFWQWHQIAGRKASESTSSETTNYPKMFVDRPIWKVAPRLPSRGTFEDVGDLQILFDLPPQTCWGGVFINLSLVGDKLECFILARRLDERNCTQWTIARVCGGSNPRPSTGRFVPPRVGGKLFQSR